MNVPALVISGDTETPSLHVHVNEPYALYHYLVPAGSGRMQQSNPIVQEAAHQAAAARHLMGVHGIWDEWERPLASAPSLHDALSGVRAAMNDTVDRLESAFSVATEVFHRDIWPQRQACFSAALDTLRDQLAPRFGEMVRGQESLLDIAWPERIEAYLVTDCYAWEGAYSHPLTLDVSGNTGTTLCETMVHEATHVADVYNREADRDTLGWRLTAALTSAGISPIDAWNAWHAVIFASSGYQIRAHIDPAHVDYAEEHHLYDRLGVPALSGSWSAYASGATGESDLIDGIMAQVAGS